jgi:hypothetical protein
VLYHDQPYASPFETGQPCERPLHRTWARSFLARSSHPYPRNEYEPGLPLPPATLKTGKYDSRRGHRALSSADGFPYDPYEPGAISARTQQRLTTRVPLRAIAK